MRNFHLASPAEQVANHLRDGIFRGVWRESMPGAPGLAKQLGVDHRIVIAAFGILEHQGILVSQGAGKHRVIVLPENFTPPALRIQILLYTASDGKLPYIAHLVHQLNEMGHVASLSPKTLMDMGMDVMKVGRYADQMDTDAWIILGGSRDVLEWFADRPMPTFAYAGRVRDVPLAGTGPEKVPAMKTALRRLHDLGHRRIVLLVREERRKPVPGVFESSFLQELEHLGIPTGDYNLPGWENTVPAFHRCIDSLLRHTPPTAMILDEMQLFVAAQQHLGQMGVKVPGDMSLICCDPHEAFDWCAPSISHIHWETDPVVRRMVKWADNIARGKDDRVKSFIKADFVEGGTIGPVRISPARQKSM